MRRCHLLLCFAHHQRAAPHQPGRKRADVSPRVVELTVNLALRSPPDGEEAGSIGEGNAHHSAPMNVPCTRGEVHSVFMNSCARSLNWPQGRVGQSLACRSQDRARHASAEAKRGCPTSIKARSYPRRRAAFAARCRDAPFLPIAGMVHQILLRRSPSVQSLGSDVRRQCRHSCS